MITAISTLYTLYALCSLCGLCGLCSLEHRLKRQYYFSDDRGERDCRDNSETMVSSKKNSVDFVVPAVFLVLISSPCRTHECTNMGVRGVRLCSLMFGMFRMCKVCMCVRLRSFATFKEFKELKEFGVFYP